MNNLPDDFRVGRINSRGLHIVERHRVRNRRGVFVDLRHETAQVLAGRGLENFKIVFNLLFLSLYRQRIQHHLLLGVRHGRRGRGSRNLKMK